MKAKLEQIQVVKVENGFVVTANSKSFVAMDEDGVKTLIEGELPGLLITLNTPEVKPDAIPRPEPAAETTTPTTPTT